MKWPFGGSGKVLRNGEQQEMRITSSRDAPHSKGWWDDISALVYGLSKGDRSTYVAAVEQMRKGNTAALLTVENTVTDELWARMVHLGYTRPAPDHVPEQLKDKANAHSVTPYGSSEGLLFLGATMAQMNGDGGSTKARAAFARGFSKLDSHHQNCPADLLHYMRGFLARSDSTLAAGKGAASDRILATYAKAGAVEKGDAGNWRVVPEAVFNAPFLLDIFLYERGLIET